MERIVDRPGALDVPKANVTACERLGRQCAHRARRGA
jgi:hypothetical protein